MKSHGHHPSTDRRGGGESFPQIDQFGEDGLVVRLSPGEEVRLEPGTLVRAGEYGGRAFRYAERHWGGLVRFESVARLDPLSGFSIAADQLAREIAAGDLEPVESLDSSDRVRTLARALSQRVRATLTPPEKGDVPDWKR